MGFIVMCYIVSVVVQCRI